MNDANMMLDGGDGDGEKPPNEKGRDDGEDHDDSGYFGSINNDDGSASSSGYQKSENDYEEQEELKKAMAKGLVASAAVDSSGKGSVAIHSAAVSGGTGVGVGVGGADDLPLALGLGDLSLGFTPGIDMDIPPQVGNLKSPAGVRKQKRRKGQKGKPSVGAEVRKGGAKRKKKEEEEVVFDSADLNVQLPVNLKLYAKSTLSNQWHFVKILERKEKERDTSDEDYPRDESLCVKDDGCDYVNHKYFYYIHYQEWDRRMDEWVRRERLRLPFQIQQQLKEQEEKAKKEKEKEKEREKDKDRELNDSKDNDKHIKSEDKSSNVSAKGKATKGKGGDGDDDNLMDTEESSSGEKGKGTKIESYQLANSEQMSEVSGHGNTHGFSAEDLAAHEEATKVKNIEQIVFGKFKISTWYYSPFPDEYNKFKTLHFCEFCLSFFGYESELIRHSRRCTLRHPPGNEIYRSQERQVQITAFEVDGHKERVYSQNLCYLSKLFLDHKTLEYDTNPFLFYIVCEVDSMGYHVVGYFSKEKKSENNYNLACILCLPCHQKKGYGKFLISLSYELSKIEERPGSPEKPISDLGKVSYMSYWSSTLVKLLHEMKHNNNPAQTNNGGVSGSGGSASAWSISVKELSHRTCIIEEDIVECLKTYNILQWYRGKWVLSDNVIGSVLKEKDEKRMKIDDAYRKDPEFVYIDHCRAEYLHWTPYFAKKARML